MDPRDRLRRRALPAVLLAAALAALPAGASASEGGAPAPAAPRSADAGKDALGRPRHPKDLSFADQEFEFRRTERVVLQNGMVVHLLEDRTLPIVEGSAYFRGGSAFDPEGKEGLASLACGMVRSGGTRSLDPSALDEELDFLAGSIGVGGGQEMCTASFSFLSRDVERGVGLFAEVLREPRFDESRFQRMKMGAAQGIRQSLGNPAGVLGRAFTRIAYAGHPYGRVPTMASIGAVTADDLRAYHAKWFHPEAFVLAVSGDFKKDEMVARLERAFAGWSKAAEPLPKFPADLPREYRGGHHVVAMPGVTQTNLRMGHWGPKQNSKDRVVCDVMNLILGGGSFWSRMTKVVRTKEGLAYSVQAQFTRGAAGGLFAAGTQTKAETSYRALGLMKGLIEEIRNEPVSAEEMSQARDTILNSFIQTFENPASLASQYARLEFQEYPADWLEQYLAIVRGVTPEECLRVAKEYLHPDKLEFVLVGDPSLMDTPPEGMAPAKILKPE
jgi:zinc protease